MAVSFHEAGDNARQQFIPVSGLGDLVQVCQHPLLASFLDGRSFNLGGCRRLAEYHA